MKTIYEFLKLPPKYKNRPLGERYTITQIENVRNDLREVARALLEGKVIPSYRQLVFFIEQAHGVKTTPHTIREWLSDEVDMLDQVTE